MNFIKTQLYSTQTCQKRIEFVSRSRVVSNFIRSTQNYKEFFCKEKLCYVVSISNYLKNKNQIILFHVQFIMWIKYLIKKFKYLIKIVQKVYISYTQITSCCDGPSLTSEAYALPQIFLQKKLLVG